MKRLTSYINLLTRGSRRLTIVASVLVMAGTFALVPAGSAFAASTNHYILSNYNRNYGWCPNGKGNIVTVSTSCAGYVWTFTSETMFAGYTAYEITIDGLCATVATTNGTNYSQGDLVLEGCVGVNNQYFVNPANPGAIYSDWGGYYYCNQALEGPLTDADGNVTVLSNCSAGTYWYLPLS